MGSIPQWQSTVERKHPRAPFVTVVELETPPFVAYGQSENISLGGMLIRCEYPFVPDGRVVVAFALPDSQRLELPARVVHCLPGARVGVQFAELQEKNRSVLSGFVSPVVSASRRSPRFPLRLTVEVRWIQGGQIAEATAETVVVSRHGCLVLTRAEIEVGTSVALLWPEIARAAQARIVYRQNCVRNLPRVALEFITLDLHTHTHSALLSLKGGAEIAEWISTSPSSSWQAAE